MIRRSCLKKGKHARETDPLQAVFLKGTYTIAVVGIITTPYIKHAKKDDDNFTLKERH